MGRQRVPAAERTPANAGKGQVTPVQVAFVVDRYLADNGYTATLASFRSEGQWHFATTGNKESPKGLLSLAEILDDYVKLKAQRIVLDQEKQRVEALMRGIQDAVQAYHSPEVGESRSMASHVPHNFLPSPSTPRPPPPDASVVSGSLSSATRQSPSLGNMLQHYSAFSTPAAHAASITECKNPMTLTVHPPAPKKYRPRSHSVASTSRGESSDSLLLVSPASPGCQRTALTIQSSSLAKILFSQPPEPSPSGSPREEDESQVASVNACIESTSTCSFLKKSTSENPGLRVNAKGRLDFEGSEGDIFDLDVNDLDLDFSDLLCNIDFDSEYLAKGSVDSVPGSEADTGQRCLKAVDQVEPVDQKPTNTHAPEGTGDGGAITATRGMTKRIRLSSP